MELMQKAITIDNGKIKVKMSAETAVSSKQLGIAEKLNNAILKARGDSGEITTLPKGGGVETCASVYTAFMKYDPEKLQKAAGGDESTQKELIQHLKETKTDATTSTGSPAIVTATKTESLSDAEIKEKAKKLFVLLARTQTHKNVAEIKEIFSGLPSGDMGKVLKEEKGYGRTPLQIAASSHRQEIVDLSMKFFRENG